MHISRNEGQIFGPIAKTITTYRDSKCVNAVKLQIQK